MKGAFHPSARESFPVAAVEDRMATIVMDSELQAELEPHRQQLLGGKMLRARLIWRLGYALGEATELVLDRCAIIELIHSASLLHDDIVDGGLLRRGKPTFWRERGIPAAVLTGDLLLLRALAALADPKHRFLLDDALTLACDVCSCEVRQELLPQSNPADWSECLQVARRKTGSLFALAALMGTGGRPEWRAGVREAGYLLGTAYQLADDILDAYGDPSQSLKSLRMDAANPKVRTLVAAREAKVDIADQIAELMNRSHSELAKWPIIARAWSEYLAVDFAPAVVRASCGVT